ncbi:unnamed protein product [Ambrosiozyma monospora]|uniref:Unnamed protein product n=1 Tax=Ambrosiozyma monospora TaxID=43982 RepID=A0A9W6Z1S8_AMBMO|nr:unnamed protein product [Ambrosiozyma monospora]
MLENSELRTQVEELKNELKHVNIEKSDAEEHYDALRDKYKSVCNELLEAKATIAANNNKSDDKVKDLHSDEYFDKYMELTDAYNVLKDHATKLRSKLIDKIAELKDLQTQFDQISDEKRTEVKVTTSSNDDSLRNHLQADNEQLQLKLDGALQDVEELKFKLSNSVNDLERKTKLLDDAEEKLVEKSKLLGNAFKTDSNKDKLLDDFKLIIEELKSQLNDAKKTSLVDSNDTFTHSTTNTVDDTILNQESTTTSKKSKKEKSKSRDKPKDKKNIKKSIGHRHSHSHSKHLAEVESVEDSDDDYDSSSNELATVSDSHHRSHSSPSLRSRSRSHSRSRSSVSLTPDVSSTSMSSPSSLNIRVEEDDQLDEIDLKTQEMEKEIELLNQQRNKIDQARKLKLSKLTEFALKQIQEKSKNNRHYHQTGGGVENQFAGDVAALGGSRTTINNFLVSNEALQDVVNGVIANGRATVTTSLNAKDDNESQTQNQARVQDQAQAQTQGLGHVYVQPPIQETQSQPQVFVEQQQQQQQQPQSSQSLSQSEYQFQPQSQQHFGGTVQLKPQTIYVEQPIQPQQQSQHISAQMTNGYQPVYVPQQQQQQPVQVQPQPQQQYKQQPVPAQTQTQPQQSYQQQPVQMQQQPVQVQPQQEYQQDGPPQSSQPQQTQQQELQQPPTFQPEPQHHRQQSRVRFSYPLQQPSPVTLQRPPERNSFQFPVNKQPPSAMSSQSYEPKPPPQQQQQQQPPRSQFPVDSTGVGTGVPAYQYSSVNVIPATPMQPSQPQQQQQQQQQRPQFNDSLLSDNIRDFDYNSKIPVMISTPKVQNQFLPTAQSTPQTTPEQPEPQQQHRHHTFPSLETLRKRSSHLRQQHQTARELMKERVEQPPHKHCALTCSCGGEYKHGVCQVCNRMLSTRMRSSSSARARRGNADANV